MLSSRLRHLRTERHKTQQDIADFLGITRQGYAKYENGKGEPDNSSLAKLADYFDVSTDYLLGRTDTMDKDDDAEFQAFINDPELNVWYKELPKSEEEELRKLRAIYEMLKNEHK